MRIGFGIIPNKDCFNFIRKLQLELYNDLGIHLSRQSPHITIKSPFETQELDSWIKYLEALAEGLDPFVISLEGFGFFGKEVLFLRVLENPVLYKLHHHILTDLGNRFNIEPDPYEGVNVKFHMSIAAIRDEKTYLKICSFIRKYSPSFNFPLDTIGVYYYQGEASGWTVIHKVDLRS